MPSAARPPLDACRSRPVLRRAAVAAALVLGALSASSGLAADGAGVTVLRAARIHTMDGANPVAEAMAYDADGRILAVGTAKALAGQFPDATTLDAPDATVIPGLIDAHGHLPNLGLMLQRADLTGTRSKAEVIERLQAFEKTLQPRDWLLGRGWDQNDWDEKLFPTAADLDKVFGERPVWVERIDGHAYWANTAAMQRSARALDGDWQPEGGQIVRDASGKATGVFVDTATDLIERQIPKLDDAATERMLAAASQYAAARGLTGVHDAGVTLQQLRAFQRLADAGKLPLRVYAMADGEQAAFDWLCKEGAYAHPGGRLQMRAVKLYADGALGSRGAALLEDYSDEKGNTGLMVTSPEGLAKAAKRAKDCGLQVATHAIGDKGNRVVLDTYAPLLKDAKPVSTRMHSFELVLVPNDLRWRVEHVQVAALEDLQRFPKLGVIASMQPTHATSDMPWAEDRVGPQRIEGAYAWRYLLRHGARLALGSDFPVESVDPRLGLHAAVTRTDVEGKPPGGWRPQEKLTRAEALRGFTVDAAYAGFGEKEVGSLAVGKRADFLVLGADPLAEGTDLRTLPLRATYVDGRAVYTAP
jgi:predicted amidohydrolase YtcJ